MDRRTFLKMSTAAAGFAALDLPRAATAADRRSAVDRNVLQELVTETARELGVVGAQMALFDGDHLHEFAAGLADSERGRPVTHDTVFQIGSVTKIFTAAMIHALTDDGLLDLDTPITTWITDLKLPDPDATARLTLRHLISMQSGIDNGPYSDHGRGDDAVARYVASLADIPLIFSPGTAFGYSNAGIVTAGRTAEIAAGKSWETLVAEKVWLPLGLSNTAAFPEDLLSLRVAHGYAVSPGKNEPEPIDSWHLARARAPSGRTTCSSAGDLVRFGRMFLDGGTAENGDRVLSASATESMHTPQVTLLTRLIAHKWCPGPYFKVWGGVEIFGHSGTSTGGSSMLLWCPKRNIAIATTVNVPKIGYPFADRLFDIVFPEVFGIDKPKLPTAADVKGVEVDLERYVGSFSAYGRRDDFFVNDGRLVTNLHYLDGSAYPETPTITSELIPLGADRFLPANPALGGNRGWDVAFWGDDGTGRASHYLSGVMALRRSA